jgi:hypothetical protein
LAREAEREFHFTHALALPKKPANDLQGLFVKKRGYSPSFLWLFVIRAGDLQPATRLAEISKSGKQHLLTYHPG